jgi:hypothetical protein
MAQKGVSIEVMEIPMKARSNTLMKAVLGLPSDERSRLSALNEDRTISEIAAVMQKINTVLFRAPPG